VANRQRWTAKRRAAIVISLLKGEASAAEAARRHGLKVATITRSFDAGGRAIWQYELCAPHAGQVAERSAKQFLANLTLFRDFPAVK